MPPTRRDVETISQVSDNTLRNALITHCYYELSDYFSKKINNCNWCTFAVWASKQAGQSIRKEDFRKTLLRKVEDDEELMQAIQLLAGLAFSKVRSSVVNKLYDALKSAVTAAADRVSNAVSRGNKKVFEEIGWEFARFIEKCCDNASDIESFLSKLQPGDPPVGQQLLRNAFRRYHACMTEQDERRKDQLQWLANLEIGLHEQTRLQPDIEEALNAAIDEQQLSAMIRSIILPQTGLFSRLRIFFQSLFGKSPLDVAIEKLIITLKGHMRSLLTLHMMTLSIPGQVLNLGRDLRATIPDRLMEVSEDDLVSFLKNVDPTPGSLLNTAATDWSVLMERMHFIADLFRCYHFSKNMLSAPFTNEQVAAIRAGEIPQGPL